MSFIKFVNIEGGSKSHIANVFTVLPEVHAIKKACPLTFFYKKTLQGCKCNVQFMKTVSILLFFHFHTIGMHSESLAN